MFTWMFRRMLQMFGASGAPPPSGGACGKMTVLSRTLGEAAVLPRTLSKSAVLPRVDGAADVEAC